MQRSTIIVLISLFLFAFLAGTGYAVPTLQLYIPDSDYDPATESWLTYENPFTLQVLGASKNGNITEIKDLALYIAVPDDWLLEEGGSVTVKEENQVIFEETFETSNTPYGTPTKGGKQLPPHGTYPSYYYELGLPDMDMESEPLVTVPNYNPEDDGQDEGIIYEYEIGYSKEKIFGIHMDVAGTAVKKNGNEQSVFAPFSHNADAVIPEPSTLLLLGMGMAIIGLWKRLRRRS